MESLREFLNRHFGQAFQKLSLEARFGEVLPSQRPDLCQYQCNGALAAAKQAKLNPKDLAQKVIDLLQKDFLQEASAMGPGFINITVKDEFLAKFLAQMTEDPSLGAPRLPDPEKVIIDFGGPNVAKPMHVGHLRSTIIGDCLQRLLRLLGEHVTSDIHLGDWGTQMGMLICEYRERYLNNHRTSGPSIDIQTLEEMYPAASAKCKTDEKAMEMARAATFELQSGEKEARKLWQHFVSVSKDALEKDFAALGVRFDLWKGESDYHERIPGLIKSLEEKGIAVSSEGALVVPLADEKNPEMPPFILVKSDGAYLYSTTDLATLEERVHDFGAKKVLYVVDKRQSLHFQQLFLTAQKSGLAGLNQLAHVAFGTMNGPDGKPFKTRAGGVMKLKDLIQMALDEALRKMEEGGVAKEYPAEERQAIAQKVGIAAIKFADLSNHRLTDYIFDLEKFTRFEGKTGPYLLYTAVRIKSILRKADEKGIKPGKILAPGEVERPLVLQMLGMPEALLECYRNYTPNVLCEFSYLLAQKFSQFYQQCHILSETDGTKQASWLGLAQACLRQLELILNVLGIEVPERM